MPYCHECGAEVDSTDQFCRNCGADVSRDQDSTPTTSGNYQSQESQRSTGSGKGPQQDSSLNISEEDHADVDPNLRSYIAEDEKIIKTFTVRNSHSGEDDPNPLWVLMNTNNSAVLTTRRLVFEQTQGIKEIGLSHISSVQSENATEQTAAGLTFGCCGGILFIGGLGSFDDPQTALIGILIGGALLAAAVWAFKSGQIYKLEIITGDEVPEADLTLFTNEDLGPTFSQTIR